MNIKSTKAKRVCEVILSNNTSQKSLWDIKFDKNLSKDELKCENGRCYFIVVDDEIYKIGFSDCKKGIKATIDSYRSSGNSGRPSDRTYGIHVLIAEKLLLGSKVEFYYQILEESKVDIELMNGEKITIDVSISGKFLEEYNLKLFVKNENKFPEWNLQEAGKPWPKYIQNGKSKLLEGISTTIDDLRYIISKR